MNVKWSYARLCALQASECLQEYFVTPIMSVLGGYAHGSAFDHALGIRWEALDELAGEQVQQIYFWLSRKLQCLQWLLVDSPFEVSLQTEGGIIYSCYCALVCNVYIVSWSPSAALSYFPFI